MRPLTIVLALLLAGGALSSGGCMMVMKSDLDKTVALLEQSEAELVRVKQDLAACRDEKAVLSNDSTKAQTQAMQAEDALAAAQTACDREKQQLQVRLDAADQKADLLKGQVDELQKERNQAAEKAMESEITMQQFQAEVKELTAENARAASQIAALQAEIDNLRKRLAVLESPRPIE